ncbi:hypothetical protein SAMN05421855_103506 [Ulvibacter litoralis]|uniref:Por secretion system C-terminal sorting domain-containing protein n=1 Tax=Ulvibacter litoralis TaxID=227084 RepID=A0A1G7H3G7_9FLAO|nr:hypothetical protein SAMN05421855_103506 [Ulvibacter litoralis]
MKKILFTYAIILSCIYSASAMKNPTRSVFTLLSNEKSFVIDLETFEGEEINYVSLEDKSGEIIFSDYIEPNKKIIKYVLDSFPADVYTVKLNGDYLIEDYTINITEESATLVGAKTYTSPIIKSHENKIVVENRNDSDTEIRLTIYSDDEIVYSFSESFEGSYRKVFNLKQLAKGNYRVSVNNDQFTKEVSISL